MALPDHKPSLLPGVDTVTSATSFDPATDGPWTVIVAIDGDLNVPFFPLGGSAFLGWQGDNGNVWVHTRIEAWDPSTLSLTLSKILSSVTPATTQGPYANWFISVIDGPPDLLPFYAIIGLKVGQISVADSDHHIVIGAGSVVDSTGTVILNLEESLTKHLESPFAEGTNQGAYTQSADLTGTVTSAGAVVTGTSTTFTTDLGTGTDSCFLADNSDQYNQFVGAAFGRFGPSVIWTSVRTSGILNVASDTSLTTDVALTASSNAYRRGGWQTDIIFGGGAITTYYGLCLIRRDSDGYIDVCLSSFTPTGEPDLPAGYTHYRVIAEVAAVGGRIVKDDSGFQDVQQYLISINAPNGDQIRVVYNDLTFTLNEALAEIEADIAAAENSIAIPKALYSAVITPTAVAGAATSWDTVNDLCTWNTTHGLVNGDTIIMVTNAPGGTTVLTPYYVFAQSTTTFLLYLTRADAVAGVNRVNVTTSVATTMRKLVYSNVLSYNMSATSPVTGIAAQTTIGLVANPALTMLNFNIISEISAQNIVDTAPAAADWFQPVANPITTTTMTFNIRRIGGTTGPGTWSQQGTTAFTVNFKLWGEV